MINPLSLHISICVTFEKKKKKNLQQAVQQKEYIHIYLTNRDAKSPTVFLVKNILVLLLIAVEINLTNLYTFSVVFN